MHVFVMFTAAEGEVATSVCLDCHAPVKDVTSPEAGEPVEGDLVLCAACTRVSVFDADGKPQPPTLPQLVETLILDKAIRTELAGALIANSLVKSMPRERRKGK